MFVSLLLLATIQSAQPASAPANVQKPPIKMECRNVMPPGSRIPERVCKPHDEWEAMAKAAQDDMHSSRNRGEGMNSGDPR